MEAQLTQMDAPGIRSAVIHRRTRTAIAEFSPRRGRLHKTWPPDRMRVVESDAGDGVSQAFVPEAAGSWCKTIAVGASEFVRKDTEHGSMVANGRGLYSRVTSELVELPARFVSRVNCL